MTKPIFCRLKGPLFLTMNSKRLIFAAKVCISIGILAYLFNNVRSTGQWQELLESPKHWHWVTLGGLACLAANLVSFYRWKLMVQALGIPFRFRDATRIGFIGLFFGLFAFGVVGGDSLRAFYATRHAKDKVSEAVTSVLADRLIGLLTMFSIAAVAFLFFDATDLAKEHAKQAAALKFVGWFVVACTAAGYAGLTLLYFTPKFAKTNWFEKFTTIPKAGSIVKKLVAAIGLYRDRLAVIAVAFALSVFVNLCFVASIFALANGLTTGNPTVSEHFVIEPIAMVSNAAPLPGGIGGMEFAMKYLYLAFSSDNGVIVGFAFRVALLLVSAIGAIVWFFNRDQVAKIESEAEQVVSAKS